MKKLFLLITLAILPFMVLAQNGQIEKIDDYLNYLSTNNQMTGKIAITRNGIACYEAGFGTEGISKTGNDDLQYRIGSITKTLTAIIAFRMQEEGLLDLTRTIESYFPDVTNAEKITMLHLLSHTSGLKDFAARGGTQYDWLTIPVSRDEIVNEIIDQGVAFEPGESARYSNSGYWLMARILEQESGISYPELLDRYISIPLGLENTIAGAEDSEKIAGSRRYDSKNKQWVPTRDFYFPNVSGVGDVSSTPGDLVTILYALFQEKIIGKESLGMMKPAIGQNVGNGLMLMPFYEETFYGHGGTTFGSFSTAAYNPSDGTAIALTLNGQLMPINNIMIGILNILYSKESELPELVGLEEDEEISTTGVYSLYTGRYVCETLPIGMRIFENEGILYAQGTGQPSFPVTSDGPDRFVNPDYHIAFEFDTEKSQMRMTQAGISFIFEKE